MGRGLQGSQGELEKDFRNTHSVSMYSLSVYDVSDVFKFCVESRESNTQSSYPYGVNIILDELPDK